MTTKQVKCGNCQARRFFVHREEHSIHDDEITISWAFICIDCGAISNPIPGDQFEDENTPSVPGYGNRVKIDEMEDQS